MDLEALSNKELTDLSTAVEKELSARLKKQLHGGPPPCGTCGLPSWSWVHRQVPFQKEAVHPFVMKV